MSFLGKVVRRLRFLVGKILCYYSFSFVETGIEGEIPSGGPAPLPGFSVREARPEDWARLQPVLETSGCSPEGLAQFREWLARDDRACLLGFVKGELIYSSWDCSYPLL